MKKKHVLAFESFIFLVRFRETFDTAAEAAARAEEIAGGIVRRSYAWKTIKGIKCAKVHPPPAFASYVEDSQAVIARGFLDW